MSSMRMSAEWERGWSWPRMSCRQVREVQVAVRLGGVGERRVGHAPERAGADHVRHRAARLARRRGGEHLAAVRVHHLEHVGVGFGLGEPVLAGLHGVENGRRVETLVHEPEPGPEVERPPELDEAGVEPDERALIRVGVPQNRRGGVERLREPDDEGGVRARHLARPVGVRRHERDGGGEVAEELLQLARIAEAARRRRGAGLVHDQHLRDPGPGSRAMRRQGTSDPSAAGSFHPTAVRVSP